MPNFISFQDIKLPVFVFLGYGLLAMCVGKSVCRGYLSVQPGEALMLLKVYNFLIIIILKADPAFGCFVSSGHNDEHSFYSVIKSLRYMSYDLNIHYIIH